MPAALLLLALLGTAAASDGAAVPDDAAEAVRLARAGSHQDALARFRALAARDPRDLESRIWMARVLVWTGERAEAERVFRSVLADAPSDLDAIVGLGSLMATRGHLDEAIDLLARADRLASDRAETLAALGRAHRLAGRTTEALSYYRRAASLAPADADVRSGLEATRRQHGHRAQATFAYERLSSPLPAAGAGSVDLSLRLTDRLRIDIHQQVQRRFGRTEPRAGAGVEWRYDRLTLVRAAFSGASGAEVLPGSDALVELERSGARADVAGTLRFARFSTASVWVASPGVTVPITERLAVSGRYYASVTSFRAGGNRVVNHSARVSLRHQVRHRLWVEGGYARGNESFETLSVDRIGRFRADTFMGGVRIDTASLASFNVSAEYQRSDDRDLVRLTAGVTQRF
jgi:YaiO family outer membrane protein